MSFHSQDQENNLVFNQMYDFNNYRVLVVDDEDLIREILSEAFMLYGAQVDIADSGSAAIKMAKSTQYDIILTDIRMPNGDGVDFIENLSRANPAKPKVFVCSAYNDLTDRRIKDLGISKVFAKPFELTFLLENVYNSVAKENS